MKSLVGELGPERSASIREAAMRARLYARDGVNNDLIDAGLAAMRALLPKEPAAPPDVSPPLRRVSSGVRVGASVVGARVGKSERRGWLYEIPCSGCGEIQIREASTLNQKLRRGGEVECPRCVHERASGRWANREADFRERARAGGPVWTVSEIMKLRDKVLKALIEAFGEQVDPDDSMPVPLRVAAGWPWSAHDHVWFAWRHFERSESERLRRVDLEERRLLKYRVEVGGEATALLAAVSSGDARAMLDVLGDIQS